MKLFELFLFEDLQIWHIVDLYLIMTMPTPHSRANQFDLKGAVNSARINANKTFEEVVLDELRHIEQTTSFGEMAGAVYDIMDNIENEADFGMSRDDVEEAAAGEISEYFDKTEARLERLKTNKFVSTEQRREAVAWLKFRDLVQADSLESVFRMMDEISRGGGRTYEEAAYIGEKFGATWNDRVPTYVFKNLRFEDEYGGEPWARIAEHVRKLRSVSKDDYKQYLQAFDRMIDMVHNTGAVRDKLSENIPGLNAILDVKGHMMDPRELRRYASPYVKRLFKDSAWREYLIGLSQKGTVTGEDPERMRRGKQVATKKALGLRGEQYGELSSRMDNLLAGYGSGADVAKIADYVQYSGSQELYDQLLDYVEQAVKREVKLGYNTPQQCLDRFRSVFPKLDMWVDGAEKRMQSMEQMEKEAKQNKQRVPAWAAAERQQAEKRQIAFGKRFVQFLKKDVVERMKEIARRPKSDEQLRREKEDAEAKATIQKYLPDEYKQKFPPPK